MNHMNTGPGGFLLSAVLVSLLGILVTPMASGNWNVVDIHHDPAEGITSDDKVTVYITLNDTTNVSSVEYQHCEIDPVGTCSIYADMTAEGNNTYSGVIPERDSGATIGYKVKIEYDNTSDKEYSPDKDNYHEYQIEKDKKDDDTSFAGAPIVILTFVTALLIVRRKKQKIRT